MCEEQNPKHPLPCPSIYDLKRISQWLTHWPETIVETQMDVDGHLDVLGLKAGHAQGIDKCEGSVVRERGS